MDWSKCITSRTITIKAKPNARKTEIISIATSGLINLDVAAPPEHNKANIEIIRFFSRLLKKRVEFVRGVSSKTKVLRVLDE